MLKYCLSRYSQLGKTHVCRLDSLITAEWLNQGWRMLHKELLKALETPISTTPLPSASPEAVPEVKEPVPEPPPPPTPPPEPPVKEIPDHPTYKPDRLPAIEIIDNFPVAAAAHSAADLPSIPPCICYPHDI